MNKFAQKLFLVLFCVISLASYSESFEGYIRYQGSMHGPDNKFKELYHITEYTKGGQYRTETNTNGKVEQLVLDTASGLIYKWTEGSTEAQTLDPKAYADEFIGFKKSNLLDTIMGIPCISIQLDSKFTKLGKFIIWYNPDYFKMDASLFKGHTYGHIEHIVKKLGCRPLKMEWQMPIGNIVQTAIEYKEVKITDSKFQLPEFKKVTKSAVNF